MTKRKKLTCSGTSGHTLLVDGDILLWRVGATTEGVSEDIAISRMNSYIDEIFHNSFCSDYRIFLTDSKGNYRVKIFPEYKANRVQQRPTHYNALREYLTNYEKAEIAHGQEADDLLGIEQTGNTIIGTIDKDLDMVPGKHYNFVKNSHYEISNAEGKHKFWCQMLTGDTTDNIPGIRGIGPKKADKLLDGCVTDKDYLRNVCAAYEDLTDIPCVITHLDWLGKLLFIRREHGQMWSVYR